jgi:hypothetical protein
MIGSEEFEHLTELYDLGYQNLDLFSQEAARNRSEFDHRSEELWRREVPGGSVPFGEFRIRLINKIKAFLRKRPN